MKCCYDDVKSLFFCSCAVLKSIMLYSSCGQKSAALQQFWPQATAERNAVVMVIYIKLYYAMMITSLS